VDRKSTRDGFGEALCELGRIRDDVVVVDADVATSTRTEGFRKAFSERFFNVGIAEQEAVLVASGMALCGELPFVSSFAAFLTTRAYDQIRTCIAMPNLNVKLVGTHGGITVGEDGITHQMTEDIALMRSLPNMKVFVASDFNSAKALTFHLAEIEGPAYLRVGREPTQKIYEAGNDDFPVGEAKLLRPGDGVTICACGIMVPEALKAAEILGSQGINAEVMDCYCIKPLPKQQILASIRRTGCCVIAEEHNIIGGLGEAVARVVSEEYPVPIRLVGVSDRYGQSGTARELQEYYGLTYREIVGAAAQVWALRRR
jgi:transketolase